MGREVPAQPVWVAGAGSPLAGTGWCWVYGGAMGHAAPVQRQWRSALASRSVASRAS